MVHKWPTIRLTGGPHAKNTVLTVDGVEQKAVSRVDVSFDVHDAVRVRVRHYAEDVLFEGEGLVTHRIVMQGAFGKEAYVTNGDTLLEAARMLVDLIEEDGR